ncbi:cyclin-like protein interacting with PHO85 [Knufia obscura]|uniref:Cyclin-like protein interacting with PHO85 n=1 Tax=Knufia obscura TaxID=1635080 RepID=A0ABR0RT17_9EURO|nr:cyclin-like protein interacting with PHO85 [Knufia obscura]
MVGGDAQHNEPDTASRPTTQRTPSSQSRTSTQSETIPDRPPSPPLQPTETPTDARPATTSRQPSNLSQHHHGFDQSGFPLSSDPRGLHSSPSSPRLGPTHRSTRSLGASEASSPSRLKVRDLAHIQSFASQEYLARPRLAGRILEAGRQYEISSMPVTDIIEMVAGLLTKITTTNDRQHEHIHRPGTPQEGGDISSQSSCVLAFHGKNVPSITILSYLSRIHKYCPTTYEVFLSLLVYFDRMTDNFNKRFLQRATRAAGSDSSDSHASSETLTEQNMNDEPRTSRMGDDEEDDQAQFFVVDSYNIHRLVIAGVTCASKFFSDVFYTNSRYAKVGGLPLAELNNLELQFLLLNDFRLSVPVEELEAYGTMLVEFYAREVITQQQAAELQHEQMQQASHAGDEVYMQGARRAPQQMTAST